MRYAYYSGCSLHGSAREYDMSWRAVCQRLGIDLVEIPDWSCCGTVHAASVDRLLALRLAARNLAIAEEMDLEVVAPCSGCYKALRTADAMLKEDPDLLARAGAGLPRSFRGSTAVKHPLYVVLEDVGLEALADVPRPLEGVAVAPYYGCVLTRPPASPPVDDPEEPQGLDRLLQAIGAQVVPYGAKTKCCGGAVLVSHPDVAVELAATLLGQAKRAGAECLAVACPMCQMVLDAYQPRIARKLGEELDLPVLYFTQLLGVALGLDAAVLGLQRLLTPPRAVLALV